MDAGSKSVLSDPTTGPILTAAVGRTSDRSLYRRFFGLKAKPPARRERRQVFKRIGPPSWAIPCGR
jgi:hypothetical protein